MSFLGFSWLTLLLEVVEAAGIGTAAQGGDVVGTIGEPEHG